MEDLALVERGRFSPRPRNDPRYYGGATPFVQTGDIGSAGTFLTRFSQTLNADGVRVSKVFPRNTILITIAANIGDTAVATFNVACPDSVVGIQARAAECDYLWLKCALEAKKGELDAQATQNAQKNINLEVLRPLLIDTPPLAEQGRIVEILSTWDRAIETVEALVANARAQKQALMRDLLGGGDRLSGHYPEWRVTTLGDAAQVIVSNVDKKTTAGEVPAHLCNYMDVYRSDRIDADMPFMRATATPAQIDRFGLQVGDVVITKDSETPDDIAIPSYVESTTGELVCGYHLAIVRPHRGTDGQFLKFYFEHPHTRSYFASRANGATRFGLTVEAIEGAPINLPSLCEQERIADAILTAERQVRRFSSTKDAFRMERAALMQQLLSGRRRSRVSAVPDEQQRPNS